MAFRNVFNLKQAIMQDMEANKWAVKTERPGILGSKEDWEQYFKYQYYKRMSTNYVDEGTVVVSTSSIRRFMNETFSRISEQTNGSLVVDNWDDDHKIWPSLELVSIPKRENGIITEIGQQMEVEHPASDYPLLFSNTNRVLGLIDSIKDNRVYVSNLQLSRIGKENIGNRYLSNNLVNLFNSEVSIDDIPLIPDVDAGEDKLDALRKIIPNLLDLISLNPNDDWRDSIGNNEDYVMEGKEPVRIKIANRTMLYYRKFGYADETGRIIGYRYIPLLPYLMNSTYDNFTTTPAANFNPANKTQYFNFGFQPFNDFEIYETIDAGASRYISTLPAIYYTSSNSFNIWNVSIYPSGAIPYMYYQPWIDINDLGQYLYLCEIKFALTEEDAVNLSYSKLQGGIPPTIDSGGGQGETAGPSGTVSGGDKTELEGPGIIGGGGIAEGTVIKTYPVIDDYLEPGFFGGVYIPTYRYIMEIKNNTSDNDVAVNKLNQIIRNLTSLGKVDALVEVFMTYSAFINGMGRENDDPESPIVDNRYKLPVISINLDRPKYICGYNSNNGYLPKNNKLLTYPYLSFEINGYGEINELKPENWSEETPTINVCSKFLPGSPIFVFPSKYNGVQYNYDAGVAGQPLPVLPYTIDSYKNEYNACVNSRTASITSLTENSISNGIYSILGGAVGGGLAGASGITTKTLDPDIPVLRRDVHNISIKGGSDLTSGIVSGAQGMTNAALSYHQGLRNFEAQLQDAENRPLAIANQNASPSLPYLNSDAGAPFIVWKSIKREFAEKIDEFFTRYGYRVNKFKEVDIHTRPTFNFLKCSQARVEGSIPQEDLMAIKSILEKGITFWHDPSKILDYSVENPAPITNNNYFYNGYYKQ